MCLQKFTPLQILWNLPLDSLLSYLQCTCRNPPQFADFVKSATGQFAKLPICACRNSPHPSLQIFWNLPLDSLLNYLYVLAEIHPFADFVKSATGQFAKLPICALAEILPPQFADFVKSATGQFAKLPICACRNPPQFADFVKSATGQFAKLPIYACRNSPHPSLQILWNLPLDSLLSYLYVLAEISPQFADFVKSATGQFAKLPICACTNSPSPSLQILWNLPLDSLLSYLHVLAEIPTPQFEDFMKSATS